MSGLLTTNEAAAVLGVGATAIKRWADAGLLACVRTVGGHRRFKAADLEKVRHEASAQGPGETWLGDLLDDGEGLLMQARLLERRAQLGSWHRVAPDVGRLLVELGHAWERGEVTVMQEHQASERLRRTLARLADALPVAPGAPRGLLVCVDGEEHTLGLSLVDLCLREAGWMTIWAGRATPASEVVGTIGAGELRAVFASASSYATDAEHLAGWLAPVVLAGQLRGIPIVLGGSGAWPAATGTVRLREFPQLQAFLAGMAASAGR